MSSPALAIPPRSVPVLGSNPALRNGTPPDPSMLLMRTEWYLAFQAFVSAIKSVGGGSSTPTGPAGGDLAGTYPDPTIGSLQGNPVLAPSPSVGDVLTWNGTDWVPSPAPIPGAVLVDSHVLTANTTIHASVMPPPANGLLVVIVREDATGGWVPTFASSDFVLAPSSVNTLANAINVVIFVADGTAWTMAAAPNTQ